MVKKEPELSSSFEERGPGAHLRRAREAANMSVDKVATALLLNAQIIEAIDADSFELLPAPTFVRGYLRGYARVLGLPAGPVLEMYDRRGFEPPPLAPDVVESHQAHTSDVPVRLVTYAVAAVLAVLVGLWWNSQEDGGFGIGADLFDWSSDPAPAPSLPAAEAPGTAPADGEEGSESMAMAPGRTDELPQDDESLAPPPAESEAPGSIAAIESAPTEAAVAEPGAGRETLAPQESPSEVAAEADPDAGVELTAAAEPAAETNSGVTNREDTVVPGGTDRTESVDESASAPPPAVTPPAVPATPSPETARTSPDTGAGADAGTQTAQSELVIEFAHESWVEVYDRERTRLFFGLVQPGRVLHFDGAQPFDILLGFGKDVRVAIDGEAFDHTPYLKHGVARFSVGAAPGGDADGAESAGTTAPDAANAPAETPEPQGRGR